LFIAVTGAATGYDRDATSTRPVKICARKGAKIEYNVIYDPEMSGSEYIIQHDALLKARLSVLDLETNSKVTRWKKKKMFVHARPFVGAELEGAR